MNTNSDEYKALRLHLAGQALAFEPFHIPEDAEEQAAIIGLSLDQYRPVTDFPRVVARLAFQTADAMLEEAENAPVLKALEHPILDDASATELRRIAQQAHVLWRRGGRVRSSDLAEIARFLSHWSRAAHAAMYDQVGPRNER